MDGWLIVTSFARISYNVPGIYDVFATQKCGEAQAEGAAYIPCYRQLI